MHSKRWWAGLAAIIAPVPLVLGSPLTYDAGLAIRYANHHWNWTIASGKSALTTLNGHQRVLTRVPGAGWFQPAFQCAEFVGRSLSRGGIPVPLVSPHSPRWPVLVNVDRLGYFLLTRNFGRVISLHRLAPGDIVLFRYPHLGESAPPTVWSHTALVVQTDPMRLDAHNAAQLKVGLPALRTGSWGIKAIRIGRFPVKHASRPSFRQGMEVEISWRDLWSSAGTHLYWGEIYRVKHVRATRVALSTVPGFVPALALSRVALTPTLPTSHGPVVILGVTVQGSPLVATARGPVPSWTGHRRVPTMPGVANQWSLVGPVAVQIRNTTYLEPIPGDATLPKAFVPQASDTVMDAIVETPNGPYAQIEWRGSEEGLGYVPLSDIQKTSLSVTIAHHALRLRNSSGQVIVVPPGMALVQVHHRDAYAGSFLSPVP